MPTSDARAVDTVFVVFSNHLDVGYTDNNNGSSAMLDLGRHLGTPRLKGGLLVQKFSFSKSRATPGLDLCSEVDLGR